MSYQTIFARLWKDYSQQNPSARLISNHFTDEGETIQNDHVAFRTTDDPRMNINVLSKVFLNDGYVEKGNYKFEEKHLFAKHFEHIEDKNAPRVFISQIILSEFSSFLRKTLNDAINSVHDSVYNSDELIFAGHLFTLPSFEIYNKLRDESEYAAWFYVFGFRANHFTISVNALKRFNTIEKVNEFIKGHGFILNNSGGEVKGTREELLRQSSTLADRVKITFLEGIFEIPACYYEFAERYKDTNGNLFSGFIAKSADKIFESTNFYKIG